MEKTFREEGIPPIITRLAFVESMFNLKARSRVGASGIWQFMPQTAKKYMRINRLVDERNSPFKATKGAAKVGLIPKGCCSMKAKFLRKRAKEGKQGKLAFLKIAKLKFYQDFWENIRGSGS